MRVKTVLRLLSNGKKTKGKLFYYQTKKGRYEYFVEYEVGKRKGEESYKRRINYSLEQENEKTIFILFYDTKKPKQSVVFDILPECVQTHFSYVKF